MCRIIVEFQGNVINKLIGNKTFDFDEVVFAKKTSMYLLTILFSKMVLNFNELIIEEQKVNLNHSYTVLNVDY